MADFQIISILQLKTVIVFEWHNFTNDSPLYDNVVFRQTIDSKWDYKNEGIKLQLSSDGARRANERE